MKENDQVEWGRKNLIFCQVLRLVNLFWLKAWIFPEKWLRPRGAGRNKKSARSRTRTDNLPVNSRARYRLRHPGLRRRRRRRRRIYFIFNLDVFCFSLAGDSRPGPSTKVAGGLGAAGPQENLQVLACFLCVKKHSHAGTRTRVLRVRAAYPNQLDYAGSWLTTPNKF